MGWVKITLHASRPNFRDIVPLPLGSEICPPPIWTRKHCPRTVARVALNERLEAPLATPREQIPLAAQREQRGQQAVAPKIPGAYRTSRCRYASRAKREIVQRRDVG